MPSHPSIFERVAVYDEKRRELELKGSTQVDDEPPPLTIQVAVVQRDEAGEKVAATGIGSHVPAAGAPAVPGVATVRIAAHTLPDGSPDPDWEVRVPGTFELRDAIAFGLQIEFDLKLGAFTTFTWAKPITITPGTLPDDPFEA
jgi:hypothetical protein